MSTYYYDEMSPKRVEPSNKILCESGWFWEHYPDGSGHLESKMSKTLYFSYDKQTYASQGGIEYVQPKGKGWSVFWGNFEDFKKFAEERVVEILALK